MRQFGHQKWITYGWTEKFLTDYSPENNLHIDLSNFSFLEKRISAIDAALLTVKSIVNNYPGPYTLMASGGIDSQAMIWAWKLSGYPFDVVSAKYISKNIFFNDYDLVALTEFSEKYNIQINYINFDVIDFLENQLAELSRKFLSRSPQISTHIKLTESVDKGTIIFAGNYISETQTGYKGYINWDLLATERYSAYLETSNSNKRVIPFFFLHRPELAYGFIKGPQERNYEINGFPVIQPLKKYNGFEKLKEYYDQFYRSVPTISKLRYFNMPSKRAFDLLFRYPYGININKLPVFYFAE